MPQCTARAAKARHSYCDSVNAPNAEPIRSTRGALTATAPCPKHRIQTRPCHAPPRRSHPVHQCALPCHHANPYAGNPTRPGWCGFLQCVPSTPSTACPAEILSFHQLGRSSSAARQRVEHHHQSCARPQRDRTSRACCEWHPRPVAQRRGAHCWPAHQRALLRTAERVRPRSERAAPPPPMLATHSPLRSRANRRPSRWAALMTTSRPRVGLRDARDPRRHSRWPTGCHLECAALGLKRSAWIGPVRMALGIPILEWNSSVELQRRSPP